jgi:hypothetical protein
VKPLSRRTALTGLAAAVTALPAAITLPAQSGQSTADMMRAFIRKLLTERDGLTAGEWIQRKIIARGLQALIGDEGEPWEPCEVSLIEEMERGRQGPVWKARL